MLDEFIKGAVWRLLRRGITWGIVCLVVWAGIVALCVLVFVGGGIRDGVQFVATMAMYGGIAIVVLGTMAAFPLQRGVRASSRLRGTQVDDILAEWGDPEEVRRWLDDELANDDRQLRIDEQCPLVVTRSWVVQVSQHGLALARLEDIRGFRLRFRPIRPFTSIGDYHISLRLRDREPEVFLIDKDRNLDQLLSELIAANEFLNLAFTKEYFQFPTGLTGRDIISGFDGQKSTPDRSDLSSYIQEKTDRMKHSREKTWVVGER